jgi:hypothetical protein
MAYSFSAEDHENPLIGLEGTNTHTHTHTQTFL